MGKSSKTKSPSELRAAVAKKEATLKKRLKVISLRICDHTFTEIERLTGIDRSQARRFWKRYNTLNEEGKPFGAEALAVGKRLYPYVAKSVQVRSKIGNLGCAGQWRLLLIRFPKIEKKLKEQILKKRPRGKGTLFEVRIRAKHLLKLLHSLLLAEGVQPNEYPFFTKCKGLKAVRDYITRILEENYFAGTRAQHGEEAENILRNSGLGTKAPETTPFGAVQVDGHKIDGRFVIEVPTPSGMKIPVLLSRLYLIVVMDCGSRAILGWFLSLSEEFTADDVLAALRSAIVPWKRRVFTVKEFCYSPGSGMPSCVLPECAWALPCEFLADNAFANGATSVREALAKLNISLNLGRSRVPMARSIVEQFFRGLEQNGFQRLPNTTGSNPKDPSRPKDAAEIAVEYRFTLQHAEELLEMIISGYHITPHSGLFGLSPLEYIRQYLGQGNLLRYVPEEARESFSLCSFRVSANIVGKFAKGRRPYINLYGARYTSVRLANSPHLFGAKLWLDVRHDDLRFVHATLEDGSDLGELRAMGRWSLSKHDLRTRRLINSLCDTGVLSLPPGVDPVPALLAHLEVQAVENARAAKAFANLQRVSGAQSASELAARSAAEQVRQQEPDWPPLETPTGKPCSSSSSEKSCIAPEVPPSKMIRLRG